MDRDSLNTGKIFILILLSFFGSVIFGLVPEESGKILNGKTGYLGIFFLAGVYILEFLWLNLFAFKHFKKIFFSYYLFVFISLIFYFLIFFPYSFEDVEDIYDIFNMICHIVLPSKSYNILGELQIDTKILIKIFLLYTISTILFCLHILLLPFACLGTYIFCKEKRKRESQR